MIKIKKHCKAILGLILTALTLSSCGDTYYESSGNMQMMVTKNEPQYQVHKVDIYKNSQTITSQKP